MDEKSGKSYTQLEYEYAVKKGKALFAVVINEPVLAKWLKEYGYEKIEKFYATELEQFRAEVLKGKIVAFWDEAKDIKLSILETLPDFAVRKNLVGWVRGDNAMNNAVVAEQLARLGKENEELKYKLNDAIENRLYLGLSYTRLKQLLSIIVDGFSLFKVVIEYGKILSLGYRDDMNSSISRSILSELEIFGIIRKLSTLLFVEYKFTEDGHNFYLKALTLQNEENES